VLATALVLWQFCHMMSPKVKECEPRPPEKPRSRPAAPRRVELKSPREEDIISATSSFDDDEGAPTGAGMGPSTKWASTAVPCSIEADVLPFADARPEELSQIDISSLTVMEKVGAGGTAEVFRGRWKGQKVAIKQLLLVKNIDVKELVSFQREVQVLASIVHPNLVKFFGVVFESRPYRIITEFCEGGTAFDLIHNADFHLSWLQKVSICQDTACGMAYLHANQIIHRDLKSLNLLLDQVVNSNRDKCIVKVADFGLSRTKEPGAKWGKMTSQVGTLHWMAPEVFCGTEYDEKCDVYSYAMVMYEALYQLVPFEDEDPSRIGSMACEGVRPDLDAGPPGMPPKLRGVMVACWARSAKDRPNFQMVMRALGDSRVAGGGGYSGGASAPLSPAASSGGASRNGQGASAKPYTSVSL